MNLRISKTTGMIIDNPCDLEIVSSILIYMYLKCISNVYPNHMAHKVIFPTQNIVYPHVKNAVISTSAESMSS